MEYAIVDIETTGGYAAGSGITEIAIRIFDGESVVDSYETLVKPSHSIPLYITALTGIDYEMVCDSPSFGDIASGVFEMLDGRIFVAHNVNFDYSFLKQHLEDAGYNYTAQKLCTVRMARKIKPGLASYNLGNLCHTLGIAIENRHRAGGDADATVILFSKLLEWDTENIIPAMLKKGSKEEQLPPNLPKRDFEALPNKPGVYYFRDHKDKVIYVGKAKDLRKRVSQHFTGHNPNPQRQNFLREIYSITYELCGTELMAFILEAIEIKRIWPKHNRILKKYEPKFGLFQYEDLQGYRRLFIGKYNKSHLPIQVFTTREGGTNKLRELTRRFDLCASLCRLSSCELCELVDKRNDLLCTAKQAPELYNEKVEQALSYLKENVPGFYIVDKGRNDNEKSCIWVENGNFYGMGYIPNDADITSLYDVKESLTQYQGSHYIMQLIISCMCRFPNKVVQLKEVH
ncbi:MULTISPECIES: exonuclease domain-containing protein [Chitinophagaceae]